MRKLTGIKEIEPFDIYDITVENDHCFELFNGIVAHNSMFPRAIVGGGTGIFLSSDTIWIIGRQQDKDTKTKEIEGYKFIINIEKSRYVKEKSQIPIDISYESGINKWSGLLDLAVEAGYVITPKQGRYARAHIESEIEKPYKREVIENNSAIWKDIFDNTDFKLWLRNKFILPETSKFIEEKETINV